MCARNFKSGPTTEMTYIKEISNPRWAGAPTANESNHHLI